MGELMSSIFWSKYYGLPYNPLSPDHKHMTFEQKKELYKKINAEKLEKELQDLR